MDVKVRFQGIFLRLQLFYCILQKYPILWLFRLFLSKFPYLTQTLDFALC